MCIDSTKGEDDSSKPEESMDAANPDPATTTDDSEMEEKRSKGKENGPAEAGAGSQDQEEAIVAEDQAAFWLSSSRWLLLPLKGECPYP